MRQDELELTPANYYALRHDYIDLVLNLQSMLELVSGGVMSAEECMPELHRLAKAGLRHLESPATSGRKK